MQNTIPSQLSDSELVAAVATLASTERRTTVALIAHLAELQSRQLYLAAGFPSMFVYCVKVLRLSEGGAYNRLEAARVARAFPVVLDLLQQGSLNLASLRVLAPHLTAANHEELLAAASGRSKREVQALMARLFPRPDVAPSIRKLPDRIPCTSGLEAGPAGNSDGAPSGVSDDGTARISGESPTGPGNAESPAPSESRAAATLLGAVTPSPAAAPRVASSLPRLPLTTALSADRYQIRFTASGSLCEKLKLAQDLLRHAVPDGDPAEIFERALTVLLADLERKKFAATDRPRASRGPAAGSRTIPSAVKRSVTARDGGRCAFVAPTGNRCETRAFLEFHHVVPYARGGPATADNIQIRCRAHNGYEAGLDFGRTKDFGMAKGFGKTKGVSAGLSTRPGTGWARGEGQRSLGREESR